MSEKNLVEAVFSTAAGLGAPTFEALGRWLFKNPWHCLKDVLSGAADDAAALAKAVLSLCGGLI